MVERGTSHPSGEDGVQVVAVGELDILSAGRFGARLEELSLRECLLRIDIRGVTFMDSVGLGVLLRFWESSTRRGKRVEIVRDRLQPQVARLFELTGVEQILARAEGKAQR